MIRVLHAVWPVALLSLFVVIACDDPVPIGPGLEGGGAPPPPAPAAGGAAPPAADPGAADAGIVPVDEHMLSFDDDDFVESEKNRDPFRNYATMFKVAPLETPQREVIMPTTSIEAMRLAAIISGVSVPRAMLIDPSGVGYVVRRADYVGRPEVVQTGGADSTPLQLNWRVDRIRPNEVVLTREDPTSTGRIPLSRVIPLFDDAERASTGLTFVNDRRDDVAGPPD